MADYHPLIARAVDGLGTSTGEARRALYERARAALVAQLRSIEPPLSEADITRERLALEDAIRKVEAETARKARTEPRPAAPPLRPSAPTAKPQAPPATPPPRRDRPNPPPPAMSPPPRPAPAWPAPSMQRAEAAAVAQSQCAGAGRCAAARRAAQRPQPDLERARLAGRTRRARGPARRRERG